MMTENTIGRLGLPHRTSVQTARQRSTVGVCSFWRARPAVHFRRRGYAGPPAPGRQTARRSGCQKSPRGARSLESFGHVSWVFLGSFGAHGDLGGLCGLLGNSGFLWGSMGILGLVALDPVGCVTGRGAGVSRRRCRGRSVLVVSDMRVAGSTCALVVSWGTGQSRGPFGDLKGFLGDPGAHQGPRGFSWDAAAGGLLARTGMGLHLQSQGSQG